MDSLEALERIKNFKNKRFFSVKHEDEEGNIHEQIYDYESIGDLFPEEIKIIEENLEALETLKEYITLLYSNDEPFMFDLDLLNVGSDKKNFEFIRKVLKK